MKNYKNLSIAVFLNRHSVGSRDQVNGILNFSSRRENWNLHILSRPSSSEDMKTILSSITPDGIIAGSYDIVSAFRRKFKRHIPAIVIDCFDFARKEADGIIFCADHDLGQAAADFFVSRGFTNFAFAGIHGEDHEFESFNSANREHGFSRTLARKGFTYCAYSEKLPPGARQYTKIRQLSDFLNRLPKPCALLAHSDLIATTVIKTCRRLHISVPMQIAVLGIDNDKSVCENISPSVSSISPDYVSAGYMAAETLDRLLSNPRRLARTIRTTYPHNGVVERMSTCTIAGNRNRVARALDIIRTRAVEGISVKDLSEAVGVSTRALELAFQNTGRKTIRDELISERLVAALPLIKNTGMRAEEIAAQCGFKTVHAFKAALKKRTGKSIRAWRKP